MRSVSSFTINALVLCVAPLVAAGCAGEARVPTAPSASTGLSSSVPSSDASGASSTAGVNSGLPFNGSLEAADTDTVAFPFLSVHLVGTGNATQLGKYAATFDFRVDLRSPATPAIGTFTLTAANGDTVSGDLVGRATIANGIGSVVETATITGGTGRFEEARGTFTVTRTVVQATGISQGSFEGTINLRP